jgi:hypothetical protein
MVAKLKIYYVYSYYVYSNYVCSYNGYSYNGYPNQDLLWLFLFKSAIIGTLKEIASRDDQALNVPDPASARQRSLSVFDPFFKGVIFL